MEIHSLFILQKTGVCIYSRNFTKDFETVVPQLITPFFSAIFSFSENVISKKTPEILEMGEFRITFRVHDDYIFALLSDSSVSLLFISTRLDKILSLFDTFRRNNEIGDYEEFENIEFDIKIDYIITGEEELISSEPLYRKIIDFITDQVLEDEILGAAILTINGKVIFSSLPNDILISSVRELEIRYKVREEFDTTFYSLDNGQKVFSKMIKIPWKLEPILIIVLFHSSVPLGMADINLEKMAKTIENII